MQLKKERIDPKIISDNLLAIVRVLFLDLADILIKLAILLNNVRKSYNELSKEKQDRMVKRSFYPLNNIKTLDIKLKNFLKEYLTDYYYRLTKSFLIFSEFYSLEFYLFAIINPLLIISSVLLYRYNFTLLSFYFGSIPQIFIFLIIIFILSISIRIIIIRLMGIKYARFYKKRYIIERLVEQLIVLIFFAELWSDDDKDLDKDLTRKSFEVRRLEYLAKDIEQYLPKKLRSGEIASDDWIMNNMKQVAESLREKKKLIVIPKKDTQEDYRKSLISMLEHIIENDWGALERIEQVKITPRQLRESIFSFLQKILRTILLGVVPILLFLVIQHTPFALQGANFNTVLSLLVIYEISVIANAVNPDFKTTISNTKDIKSMLQ